LFAGEMLRWLAGGAACEERGEALGVRAGDLLFGMRVEPGAVVAEDVEKQEFRGECEGWDVRFTEMGEALLQCAADVCHFFTVAG
jgi:hypothetical protein